jgi:hypothetical protein
MNTETPSEPGGIAPILRLLAADMGMSREELLTTAVNMLAAAVDPSPLPERPINPKFQAAMDRLDDIAAGRRSPDAETPEEVRKLRELHARPASAKFTPEEAAVYLNATTALLRTWRWRRRGPPHEGSGRFIRYPKSGLDAYLTNDTPEAT